MLYHLYEAGNAALFGPRLGAQMVRASLSHPFNPLSYTPLGNTIVAGTEVFESVTRRFGQPEWGLDSTVIDGKVVAIEEEIIVEKAFCGLLHFKRDTDRKDPKILVVAPMSGHFATLLRGTIEALLPHHDVYVTEWVDSRQVPLSAGDFSLDTYISYLRSFLSLLGGDSHVLAVCQPAVPVMAAVSLMADEKDPNQPLTMTLMGGPIDTRISMTAVNKLAEEKPLSWFEDSIVQTVPVFNQGGLRKVYPGFMQLGGFMSMNLDRHIDSHKNFYKHLIQGDGESAAGHRKFYDEYMAVMDIPATYYIDTVDVVFQRHLLPKGEMEWLDPITGEKQLVDPSKIKKTALFTVEGELDDISACGQTTAAHVLCSNLAAEKQFHWLQKDVGHYGIFNGGRYRSQIMPRIRHLIRKFDKDVSPIPKSDLDIYPDLAPEQFNKKKHLDVVL
jgi:poly(3-hydroxybutyrate) depolymerase